MAKPGVKDEKRNNKPEAETSSPRRASPHPTPPQRTEEVLAVKLTKEDLAYLLFLLFNLSLTSHSLQTIVKPIFGKTYGELSFHAGTFLSFIIFSFALSDKTNLHRRILELVSVLQVVAAVGARSLGAVAVPFFDDEPTVAAWVVHAVLSFPMLGLGGAVWLHWSSKFMEQEPTRGGQLAIKVFSCVALISVVKYLEPLIGNAILWFIDLPPRAILIFLAMTTYSLSVIFRPPGPSSSRTRAASGSDVHTLSKFMTVLSVYMLMLAVSVPPRIPSALSVQYQRFTPYGFVQVIDNTSTKPQTRYLRLDSSIIGAVEVNEDGSVGDALDVSDALLNAVRLVPGAKGKKALFIGAQSGAPAKSLISVSYNTTVIDARTPLISASHAYFGTPDPDQFVAQDPAIWMRYAKQNEHGGREGKFDVVVHDVFEGGELLARMYTMEFWDAVRSVLDEGGVLAVKYVGKPNAVTFKSTLNVLRKKFRTCRVFHSNPLDHPPSSTPDEITELPIFCTLAPTLSFKPLSSSKVHFSPRTSAVLSELDKREIDISSVLEGVSPEKYLLKEADPAVIRMWGKDAIVDYWKLMRRRYPAPIWHSY